MYSTTLSNSFTTKEVPLCSEIENSF